MTVYSKPNLNVVRYLATESDIYNIESAQNCERRQKLMTSRMTAIDVAMQCSKNGLCLNAVQFWQTKADEFIHVKCWKANTRLFHVLFDVASIIVGVLSVSSKTAARAIWFNLLDWLQIHRWLVMPRIRRAWYYPIITYREEGIEEGLRTRIEFACRSIAAWSDNLHGACQCLHAYIMYI